MEDLIALEPANRGHPAGEVHGLWTAIQHIGTAHADHPDYQESWRP